MSYNSTAFSQEFRDWFWSRIDRSGACWFWIGATSSGYGHLRVAKRDIRAHRLAWEFTNGPIPDSLEVCHDCDRNYPPGDIRYRRCCRPDHLFLGTRQENHCDMYRKGRENTPVRKGEQNGRAKLTAELVRLIRQKHAAGATYRALAQEFGLGMSSIGRTVTAEHWAHIDGTDIRPRHPARVLRPDDVRTIRAALATGETTIALARRFGVSRPTISMVKNGRSWRGI